MSWSPVWMVDYGRYRWPSLPTQALILLHKGYAYKDTVCDLSHLKKIKKNKEASTYEMSKIHPPLIDLLSYKKNTSK